MFNKMSLYALNKKNPDAVVYLDANGKPIYVTREEFESEEAFLEFKAWSDENFYAEDRRDVTEDKRHLSLDDLSEAALAVPAIDDSLEAEYNRASATKRAAAVVEQFKEKLTDIQFRRLWLYYVEEKTLVEIAAMEGVDHQRVSKSIQAAKKKIKKFFPDA